MSLITWLSRSPVTDRSNRNISSIEFLATRTSTLDDRLIRDLGDFEASGRKRTLRRPLRSSIHRLLDNEESEGTSAQEGSSEEESSEGEPSSSEEGTSDDDSSPGTLPQGSISIYGVSSTNAGKRAKQAHLIKPQQGDYSSPSHRTQKLECVSIPPLLVPRSLYSGWKHSLPVFDERSALSRVLEAQTGGDGQTETLGFHDILVEDFVIYRPDDHKYYPGQMVTLDNIVSNRDGCQYLLDGVLRCGEVATYVEAMEIDIDAVSIDGFEDIEVHSVQDMTYLQTIVCARRRHQALECWYHLGKPSKQYQDLHLKFLWVADLAKHVIDYLNWRYHLSGDSSMVHLNEFQHNFLERLIGWHGEDLNFQKWLRWYGKMDFKIALNRHREFIFSRAYNLRSHYLKHDLWSELMVRPTAPKGRPVEDTIVTPYIRHCCRLMEWSHVLDSRAMSKSVMLDRQLRAESLGFSSNAVNFSEANMAGEIPNTALALETAAESGSFTDVSAEEALNRFAIVRVKQTKRKGYHYLYSFVYVQDIARKHCQTQLKVIFVHLPSETICRDAYYPHGNELFLSDTCNCSANGDPILLSDILRLVNINVGADLRGQEGYFMRQKFIDAEDALCTIRESDFTCPCRRTRSHTRQLLPEGRRKPLQGLSLFAGCGNFDMGLEAFGAVEFNTAIDISECGLKTYAANRPRGYEGLILDSVNPCLAQILEGSEDYPSIGHVHCLVAGCPCQGFSMANGNRHNDRSHRNCSLLASTLSYVETYLPEYALIENVEAMGAGIGNSGNQAIACLVGMGYQVRRLRLNCCDYDSAQSRSRLFILVAAPNVSLPDAPIPSGVPKVKASAVSKDLPEIDNDDLICVSYPDHIPGAKQTFVRKELIRRVDRYPKRMNFQKSILVGSQAKAQLGLPLAKTVQSKKYHNAYARLDPDGFIPTITTAPRPGDGHGGGKIIHWDQHRTLSLLEARRAQGFPDDQVIIGSLPEQWYQVGNAVNRQVATAIGKVIADSWFSERRPVGPEIVVVIPTRRQLGQPKDARQDHAAADDALQGQISTTLPSGQIQKETGSLAVGEYDLMKPAASWFVNTRDSIEITCDSDDEDIKEAKATAPTRSPSPNVDRNAAGWLNGNQMERDEVEFVKALLRPKRHGQTTLDVSNGSKAGPSDLDSGLTFSQIQRREMSTIERSAAGEKKSVRMIAERNFEFRIKAPTSSSSSQATVYGSAENPIDVEMEGLVSKRRREDPLEDDEDEDDGLKGWVGKRVRSRLND